MSIIRFAALVGCAAVLLLGTAACGPDDTGCDAVTGRFAVQYTYVDGDCDVFQPFDVAICGTGNSENSTGGNGYSVVTTINATGCTIFMEQTRYVSQKRDWLVRGDLDVIAGDELHGQIFRQEFDDNEMPTCQGHYDARVMKLEDNPIECASNF